MVNPCPGYSITTPYGQEGSAWGCGWHDGADYASPSGTDVVSAWGGTVVEAAYPTSFGSAFGRAVVIDHDHLPDGSPGGWGLYAHLSAENVSVGQRVDAGQKIGDVGTTGNSSGNHLHFGVYMTPYWTSGGGIDPQPWIEAGSNDMGLTYDYLEKPGGTLTVGRSYVDLDWSKWDSPVKGWESTLSYLNVEPTFKAGKTHGALRIRLMRENGDPHGYQTIPIDVDDLEDDDDDGSGNFLTQYLTWEKGEEGKWTKVQIKCVGGLESARIGTRYTSKAIVSPN